MILYRYAKDSNGNVIKIDDVIKENRRQEYRCIGCDNLMEPVLGNKRQHHFRHKNQQYGAETCLHKYAKWYIKNLFETQDKFLISFQKEITCCKCGICSFQNIRKKIYGKHLSECKKWEYTDPINLKYYYDICEEEFEYKRFRADLVLRNSKYPRREPVFIEIVVTHKCDEQKYESGIRIIEIFLPKDCKDLSSLKELKEEKITNYFNDEIDSYDDDEFSTKKNSKNNISIFFRNFNRKNDNNRVLSLHRFNEIFFINKKGIGQLDKYSYPCNEFEKKIHKESLFEIHFVEFGMYYPLGVAISNTKKIYLPYCEFCHNCWKKRDGEEVCNKGRIINNNTQAKECPDYEYEPYKALKLIEAFKGDYYIAE